MLIDSILPGQKSLVVESTSARIPVVHSLNDVSSNLVHFARACIVVQEKLVLIWSHNAGTILHVAHDVERQLGKKVGGICVRFTLYVVSHCLTII